MVGWVNVWQWVASEPTAFNPDSFELKKPDSGEGHGGHPQLVSEPMSNDAATTAGGLFDDDSDREGGREPLTECLFLLFDCMPLLFACVITLSLFTVSAAASFRSRFHGKLPSPLPLHDMPYNPHMTTGSLVLCSLLGRGHGKKVSRAFHDTGSRFSHLQDAVSAMAGATKVGFNNPVFLALKQRSLKARISPLRLHESCGIRCA